MSPKVGWSIVGMLMGALALVGCSDDDDAGQVSGEIAQACAAAAKKSAEVCQKDEAAERTTCENQLGALTKCEAESLAVTKCMGSAGDAECLDGQLWADSCEAQSNAAETCFGG
jgi:hypothetical protein